jgi:hypothetical protein
VNVAVRSIDRLSQASAHLRRRLDRCRTAGERIRALWAVTVNAADLAAPDVIEEEFVAVARETGLAHDLGRHADEDIRHVISWALRNRDPFGCSR